MKTEPKRAMESFLTGRVLQQFLLMVKTLGKERKSTTYVHCYLSHQFFNISFYYSLFFFVLSSSTKVILVTPLSEVCSPWVWLSMLSSHQPMSTGACADWCQHFLSFWFHLLLTRQEEFNHGIMSNGRATGACCFLKNYCMLNCHDKEPW